MTSSFVHLMHPGSSCVAHCFQGSDGSTFPPHEAMRCWDLGTETWQADNVILSSLGQFEQLIGQLSMRLLWRLQVAVRGRAPDGTPNDLAVRDTGLDGQPLGGLSYSDALPLRMCPGGMMSLVYASLVLSFLGAPPCQAVEGVIELPECRTSAAGCAVS